MKYSFIINIDVIKILKFYLKGFIPAYLIVLYLETDNLRTYLKTNNFTWKEMKKKYFLFFNKKYIQGIFMSWLLVLFFIIAILGNINSKLTKRYYFWNRIKDIFKGLNKKESLYFYCNNKYFRRVKEKLNDKKYNKLLYRIMKKELKIDGYSDKTWNDYIIPLTLKEFESYFDYSEIEELKANYELLVFERFCKIYL